MIFGNRDCSCAKRYHDHIARDTTIITERLKLALCDTGSKFPSNDSSGFEQKKYINGVSVCSSIPDVCLFIYILFVAFYYDAPHTSTQRQTGHKHKLIFAQTRLSGRYIIIFYTVVRVAISPLEN